MLVTSSESTGCVCGTSVLSAVTQVHCPLFFLAPGPGAIKPMMREWTFNLLSVARMDQRQQFRLSHQVNRNVFHFRK